MKRSLKIILFSLAAYLLLLAALVAAESGAPGATIRDFWDAVWFSLITMTTVGYGDLSPVTAAGRVLGLVFALCSIGILTALIGIGLSLLGGQIIPEARLRLGRGRRWYAFHEENEDSAVLAEALRSYDPGCLLIFPGTDRKLLSGADVVRIDAGPERLRALRGDRTEGCGLFFLGEDPWDNYSAALEAVDTDFPVYCMTDARSDDMSPNLHLFSRTEALGRCYWKDHPLRREERLVVLLGCRSAGSAILERAVLTNVIPGVTGVEYHIFDSDPLFAALHPALMRAMGPDNPAEDRLIFHRESWHGALDLLRAADRIILCADSDEENLTACEQLRTWFAFPGEVHLRLNAPVPPLQSFGERGAVITPEFVMKDALNRQAVTVNDLYNEGSARPTEWRDLGWFLRESNVAAADHLIVKIRYLLGDESLTEVTPELCRRAAERLNELRPDKDDLLQETEHRRWMRFHWLYNWEYAAKRDNSARRHHLLVPYEELSEPEKKKDLYAWEMLNRLSEKSIS